METIDKYCTNESEMHLNLMLHYDGNFLKNENLDVIRPLTLAYMYKKKLNATHRCWFLHVVLQKYHIS